MLCRLFSPMTTTIGSWPPAVRCRGSCIPAVSRWNRLIILDRVKQLRNVLLSGCIHLDHRPLHTDIKGNFESLSCNWPKQMWHQGLCLKTIIRVQNVNVSFNLISLKNLTVSLWKCEINVIAVRIVHLFLHFSDGLRIICYFSTNYSYYICSPSTLWMLNQNPANKSTNSSIHTVLDQWVILALLRS